MAALLVVAAVTLGTSGPNYMPLGAAGSNAVAEVEDQLRADCLGLDQATALLASELAKAGVPGGYDVRTDGGIMSRVEDGDWEAVLEHLGKGCYTYSGTGADASGRRLFFLSGPETLAAAKQEWGK